MVLGRRARGSQGAYTSKKPGKTQQYNYFILNEAPAAEWQPFHLVDLPGLGYAKVPGAQRNKWLSFLGKYTARRQQLRILFHLIDGEVGPMKTDLEIMRTVREALLRANSTSPASAMMTSDVEGAMGQGSEAIGSDVEGVEGRGGDGSAGGGHEVEDESGCSWQYVVVLTKADKGGPMKLAQTEAAVARALAQTGCPPPLSIIPTSSKSKAGRGAVWRLMRDLVLPD